MRKQEPLPPVQLICLVVMFGLACIAIQQRGHSLKLGRLGGRLGLPLSPVAALVPVDATGREPASREFTNPSPQISKMCCVQKLPFAVNAGLRLALGRFIRPSGIAFLSPDDHVSRSPRSAKSSGSCHLDKDG